MHVYGGRGFRRFLAPAARIYAANTNLIGGIALLENAYGETAEIHALDRRGHWRPAGDGTAPARPHPHAAPALSRPSTCW